MVEEIGDRGTDVLSIQRNVDYMRKGLFILGIIMLLAGGFFFMVYMSVFSQLGPLAFLYEPSKVRLTEFIMYSTGLIALGGLALMIYGAVSPPKRRPELTGTVVYCSKCGTPNGIDSKFCFNCGTELKSTGDQQKQT